jgi:hypothetical protein
VGNFGEAPGFCGIHFAANSKHATSPDPESPRYSDVWTVACGGVGDTVSTTRGTCRPQ